MSLIQEAASTTISKLLADRALLRNATVMQGASGLSFLLAYVFHVYMGRALGPAEYGLLGALLAILYPIAIPLHTVQNTLAKLVATAMAQSQDNQVSYILGYSLGRVALLSLVVAALMLLASPLAFSFLNMSSFWPLVMMTVTVPPLCLLSVERGVLQGLLSFTWVGVSGVFEKATELGLGVGLVSWGLGATGGMGAYAMSAILALILTALPLYSWARNPRVDHSGNDVSLLGHGWPIFLAIVLVTLMSSIDLLLVRFFLSPTESGYYASVSMVGKVTFLSAFAIAGVLFPTATRLQAQGESHSHVLAVGLAFIGLVGGGLLFLSALFPAQLMIILFGSAYLTAAPLLAPYVAALALLSLSIILMYYHLALERNWFLIFLGLAALGEVALLSAFHGSALEIIWSLVATFSLLLLANIVYLAAGKDQPAPTFQPPAAAARES